MENNEKQKSEKKFCKPAKPSYSKSKEKRCHRRFSRYFGNELRPGPQNNGGPIQHVPHVPQYHGFGPAANLPHFHPEQRIFYYEKAPRFPPPFREHGSYPVCHNSPFGPVSASVFNGTTFYHYYNNAISNSQEQHENVFHDHGRECPCSDPEKAKQTIEKKSKLASSSIHREQSSSGEVTNRCLSFTSISSASSRSSSPFLLSTRSSARDSGLVSTASTDDDASLVHASSCKIAEKNLVESIKQAAEEAMSDETLLKNSYLFRQMKRNAEGFVSIKLLASSKKLKKLLSPGNESLLLSALLNSDKLKVNKTNTKVRRCFPPSGPFISNKKTTSLVLINPKNIDGIEDVTKIMKVYGEISQIRILRPDRPLPLYLKVYSNLIPQLGKVLCVTVEFEKESSLFNAYQALCLVDNNELVLLGAKIKRSPIISPETASLEENDFENSGSNNSVQPKAAITRLDSGGSIDSKDSGVYGEEFQTPAPQEKRELVA